MAGHPKSPFFMVTSVANFHAHAPGIEGTQSIELCKTKVN
ncbi:MAG: hypothetical protein H6Q57_1760 [Geobacteraceae bacterium]|nr:hypothetical protein [Geobacteraceae bacterium]